MHNFNRKAAAIAAAAIFAFTASTVYTIGHNLIAALFLLSSGIALYAYDSRRISMPGSRLEDDTLAFLDNLAKQGGDIGPFQRIRTALNSNFVFYRDFRRALDEYGLSGDSTRAFEALGRYRSNRYFEIAVVLIRESLESGADVSYALQSLYSECLEHHEIRSKHIGEMANSRMLQLMGSVIFFPIFGGLSLNVLRLSTSSLSMQAYAVFGSAVLLYIFMVNLIAVAFNGRGILTRTVSMGMRVAIASFVFGLSSWVASLLV